MADPTPTLTPDKLAELDALASKATQGPYTADVDHFGGDEDIAACVSAPNVEMIFTTSTDIKPDGQASWNKARTTQAFTDARYLAALDPATVRALIAMARAPMSNPTLPDPHGCARCGLATCPDCEERKHVGEHRHLFWDRTECLVGCPKCDAVIDCLKRPAVDWQAAYLRAVTVPEEVMAAALWLRERGADVGAFANAAENVDVLARHILGGGA